MKPNAFLLLFTVIPKSMVRLFNQGQKVSQGTAQKTHPITPFLSVFMFMCVRVCVWRAGQIMIKLHHHGKGHIVTRLTTIKAELMLLNLNWDSDKAHKRPGEMERACFCPICQVLDDDDDTIMTLTNSCFNLKIQEHKR